MSLEMSNFRHRPHRPNSFLLYMGEGWAEMNLGGEDSFFHGSPQNPKLKAAASTTSTQSGRFTPRTASDLLSQESEPISWVWEPYLPVGSLSLLTAYMKVGKTTFAYALALAVAEGQPFLGYPTIRGPLLILAVEEHPRDVRLRLERFGLTKEDSLHVHTGRLHPDELRNIERFVKEQGVRLILLDTLSRYWEIKDENDNAEIIRRVSPFLDLARETNTAVVLIHHERKGGGEDGRGIRGGSALFGLVDQSLTLERRAGGDEGQRILKALGRYVETPSELILELNGDEYRALGTADQFTLMAKQEKVLAALSDVPQTVESLTKAVGLPRTTTQQVLTGLGKKVARQGRGTKGDPFLYCRPATNSNLPNPPSNRRNRILPPRIQQRMAIQPKGEPRRTASPRLSEINRRQPKCLA